MTRRFLVAAIWLLFLVRGAFYCTILPLWEGYDEWSHYAYVQHLRVSGRLPASRTAVSVEIAQSMATLPLPRMMRGEGRIHDEYWRLPARERQELEAAFLSIHPQLASESSAGPLIYEAQQPPLYYLLMTPADWLASTLHLSARVFILRLLSVLIASLVIPLLYLLAKRIELCALCAALPELMIDVSRVGNECLAIALISGFLVALFRKRWLISGVMLGLALLTKAYTLALTPVPLVASLFLGKRRGAATLAIALLISGAWYARNLRTTGTLSGEQVDVSASRMPVSTKLQAIAKVNWLKALDTASFSHVWWGGWSFLNVRSWVYHVIRILAAISALGVVWLVVRIVRRGRFGPFSAHLLTLAATLLLFTAGMAYFTLSVFVIHGESVGTGWYFYAVIAAEITLLCAGLRAIARSQRIYRLTVALVITLFIALDLYAMHFVLIPYYTGLIQFPAGGRLENFHIGGASISFIADRLSTNRGFTSGFLLPLWILYVLSSLALPWIALRRCLMELRVR